ncbi:MAG: hypothetical protein NUV97_03475 [archaeon]|nr:hypothetical protein [archaeon]
MKFKDYIGKEGITDIRNKLDDFIESDGGGFIIICNLDKKRVTDAYQNVCINCVLEAVENNLESADKIGLLAHTTN